MKTMGFRKIITLSLSTVCALSLSSCFKDEPLNAECDIEQAYIHPGSWLKLWFTNASDTLVNVQSDQEPPSSRKAEACTISPKVLLHTWLHRKTSSGPAPIR